MIYNYPLLLVFGIALFLSSCTDKATAKKYFLQGQEQYNSADYNSALESYNKALQLYPEYWTVFSFRAKAKLALMDYEGCIGDCDTAILNLPIFKAESYLTRGTSYLKLLRFYEAQKDLVKAHRMSSDNRFDAKVLSELGQVHMLKAEVNNKFISKQIPENLLALDCFNESIELNPALPNTYRRRAFAKLKLKVRANLTDGGKSDFEKANEGGEDCTFELKTFYHTGYF